MALRSSVKHEEVVQDIEEVLEALEKLLERTKVMYEQYFMGIQKMPPSQLHRDIERKIREFTQKQIRNTGLRFRFTTLSQKFGSYNSYWQRTLRKIEQGTYIRDIHRVKRRAERTGEDIPEEILAAMPKLMRDRIKRDRERLKKRVDEDARRDQQTAGPDAQVSRAQKKRVHTLDENELADMDVDSILREMEQNTAARASQTDDDPPTDEMNAPTPQQVHEAHQRAAAARARTTPPPPPGSRARTPTDFARGTMPSPGNGARAAQPRPGQDPRRQSAPRPPGRPPPGMTEDESRKLYRRYVQARKLVGERTDNLSYDRLMNTLNKQAPQIMKQHKAQGVQFGIVIKGDKVVLKAKPKK